MLNIKQIQYFAACAKTGSFSQAAELLFTTQSNVSKVIRSMEDDMRTQLFVRHAKGHRADTGGRTGLYSCAEDPGKYG